MSLCYKNKDGEIVKVAGSRGASAAEQITYDNTKSEVEATNVQDAIDGILEDIAGGDLVHTDRKIADITLENDIEAIDLSEKIIPTFKTREEFKAYEAEHGEFPVGTKIVITSERGGDSGSAPNNTYDAESEEAISGKGVADAISGLDVDDTEETGKYVSAVSEADGKITVTRTDLPTSLPASDVTDEYSATGKVPVSGTAVASALSSCVKTDDARLTNARASNDVQDYAKIGSGITVAKSVPSDAKFTDTTYLLASISASGLMSSGDKSKLNNIASGATAVFESTVNKWGFTKNVGTVTKVEVGTTEYLPTSGVVTIPAYPTSLPASNTKSTYSATGTDPVNGTAVASAIIGKENSSNKVSAWQPTPDDNHYPSEKLVKDTFDKKANKTFIESVDNETSIVIVPENATFAAVGKVCGKTIKCRNIFNNTKTSGNSKGLSWVINPNKSITLNTPSGATSGQVDITLAGYWGSTTVIYPNDTYTIINANPTTVAYNGVNFKAINNTTAIGTVTSSTRSKTFTGAITELYIVVDSGKTFNNYTIYPMLVRGTTTDITYEPYFEGLRSAPVENVVSCGNNLFDYSKAQKNIGIKGDDGTTYSVNGVTSSDYIPVTSNIKLFIEGLLPFTSGYFGYAFYNSSKSKISATTWNDSGLVGKETYAITVPNNSSIAFMRVCFYDSTSNYTNGFITLNKTTVSMPQEILDLPDYGIEGNVLDLENMKYYHNVTKTVLSKYTFIKTTNDTTGLNRYDSTTSIQAKFNDVLINSEFETNNTGTHRIGVEELMIHGGAKTIVVFTSKYNSLADFVDAVKDNELVYALATPEVIDISSILFPFPVESGETIFFENEHNLDVQNTVLYKKEVL